MLNITEGRRKSRKRGTEGCRQEEERLGWVDTLEQSLWLVAGGQSHQSVPADGMSPTGPCLHLRGILHSNSRPLLQHGRPHSGGSPGFSHLTEQLTAPRPPRLGHQLRETHMRRPVLKDAAP